VYTQIEVNRGLPIPYLVKYFTKSGSEWHIRKDLREMVEFRELNLVQPWPVLPTLDLVLMRNVLLYFMPETRRQVLSHLARRMHSDGWVFLGGAESTLVLDDAFEHVSAGRTIVHRPRRASAGRSERAA
jgi:chemotaxis protein methyltransferase CheR